MVWLLLLPIRLVACLVFGLLWIPFVLVRLVVKAVAALILLPLFLVLMLAGFVVGGVALFLVPAASLVLLILLVGALAHAARCALFPAA